MFRWLQNKFSDSQRKEAERFYTSLRGADTGVIDLVSGSQMYWSAFYEARGRDLYSMELWITGYSMFPVELVKSIQGLQKQGSTSSATGLMVWLHSARALLWPELRYQGRLIWQELATAQSDAEQLAYEMCAATETPSGVFDRTRIPLGLEPLSR